MSSYDLGREFELVTQDFFLWLFDAIDIHVNNFWIQKSGYQFGFDVGFEIAVLKNDFFKRGIYIECKNYEKTTLEKTQLHDKLLQFDMSSYESKNSIFIFLSPKVDLKNCTQDSNPVLLENYFNNKLEIKTIILTPNNNVKKIFALNEEIYYRVYGEQLLVEQNSNDNNIIFNYFKKLLFSKGEIPNFNLVKEREDYLKEASIVIADNFYIERKLKTNKFSFIQEDKNLKDLLKDNDFILLLGEPGSGKTTELKNIATYFKENIEVLGITPIFLSLSNIKEFNNIFDIFPSKWNSNNRILLLLDSFDEFEFKNKLSEQIEILLKLKDISIKIIISCRTYAYNEELISFKPEKFYLDGFNINQSIELLNKQFQLTIEEYDKINKDKFKDVIEDPFMLKRLGIYYQKHKNTPNEIVDLYNDIKLEILYADIEIYKIFALILELTKDTSIEKKQLRSLFGIKYNKLIKLELIQKSFDKQSFKFIHKNYQEYFAALALSELSFDDIINFIVIEKTNKTHPSLFNTITFLINILDSVNCNLLVEWFVYNEPELLFKADKNRVGIHRIKVFQNYFETECIKKTFWISSNRTFTVKEIAEFGNCDENLKYLVSVINNKENQFRIITSALDLLSYFSLDGYEKELKQIFLTKLNEKTLLIGIKSQIILCSKALKFENDEVYFNEVYSLIKLEDSNEINDAFLYFIYDREEVDSIFDYLLEEFKRIHNITKRVVYDEVHRGNDWKVSKLITKLNDSNNFIDIITYYFQDDVHIDSYSEDHKELLNKCIHFAENESNFIVKLLKSIIGKTNYYTNEKLLKEIIKNSNQIRNAVECLIENEVFSKVDYFMSSFIDKESLIIVKDNYLKGNLKNEDIERLRNFIWSNGNPELSQDFNNLMIENGFKSEKIFHTIKEIDEIQIAQKAKHKLNFDILFDSKLFFEKIKLIFSENSIDVLNDELINKIEKDWYDNNGYWNNSIDVSIRFLRTLIYEKGTLGLEKIKEIVFGDDELYYLIKSKIENNKNSNVLFNISDEQIFKIKIWSEEKAKEVDFSQVFQLININSFNHARDYKKLKTILFFVEYFNFDFEIEFLINCIEFYEMESIQETERFRFLINKINDKERFDNRIVKNILSNQLFSIALTNHIDYALECKLSNAYSKIRDCFLLDNYEYNLQSQFEKYVNLTGDFKILKECAVNIKSYKCWIAIKVLVANKKEEDFCCSIAIEYLSLDAQIDNNFLSNSLEVLFAFNREEAIKYYFSLIKNNVNVSVTEVTYLRYNKINDLNFIKLLFDEIYLKKERRNIYSNSTNFMNVYISNLSKVKGLYEKITIVLDQIKEDVKDTDSGVFYVNFLKDTAKNSFINEMSKKYSFEEALELVEKILN